MDLNDFWEEPFSYCSEEREPCDYIFRDFLLSDCVGILAGEPGVGKGFFALQMALAVASGMPLLGRYDVERTGNVLYVSGEDSRANLKNRMHDLFPAILGIPITDIKAKGILARIRRVNMGSNMFFEKNLGAVKATDTFEKLAEMVKELNPRLIIMDTLAALTPGLEENSKTEMSFVINAVLPLVNGKGRTLIFTHHFNKSVESNGDKKEGITLKSLRGSSAIAGSCRWIGALTEDAFRVLKANDIAEKPDIHVAREGACWTIGNGKSSKKSNQHLEKKWRGLY